MYFTCLSCGAECLKRKNCKHKYCSNACQMQLVYENSVKTWLDGSNPGWTGKTCQIKSFVRRYLKETRGTACEVCGWDGFHPVDGLSLTEIDHVDGDAMNCVPENLKILCPNCHSMTPTFRARNKSSKRDRS
jgi:hypothetical protein